MIYQSPSVKKENENVFGLTKVAKQFRSSEFTASSHVPLAYHIVPGFLNVRLFIFGGSRARRSRRHIIMPWAGSYKTQAFQFMSEPFS
jgi:hypothetical protein